MARQSVATNAQMAFIQCVCRRIHRRPWIGALIESLGTSRLGMVMRKEGKLLLSRAKRAGRTTVSYFGPPRDARDGSAMGAFHNGIVANLACRNDILLRYIDVRSFGSVRWRLTTILQAAVKLAGDAISIIGDRSALALMVYPSIPLVPLTTSWKLPIAILSYLAWSIKRALTGQEFVVVVADLPLEQAEDLGLPLGTRPSFYRLFEGLLFHTASRIVVPSDKIAEHIVSLYRLEEGKLSSYRVYAYQSSYSRRRDSGSSIAFGCGLRILYAGDLRRPHDQESIIKICGLVGRYPSSRLFICGPGGEFLGERIMPNVEYLGVLDSRSLDGVAASCHVGLILYSPACRYYQWAPTSKYSTYVANGLAVLSTRLGAVGNNLMRDGVGLALDWQDLLRTLENWIKRPQLALPFKQAAEKMADKVRGDFFIREWFDPILREMER